MTLPLLALFLLKFFVFAVVGLSFFRKARHNLMWVLTALPFLVNTGLLVAYYARPDALPSLTSAVPYEYVRTAAAVLCAVAIGLYMFTLGAHRAALPGWHQPDDAPDELVTWGPYRRVRHPFYTSYILFFAASSLATPTWPVLVNALYLFGIIRSVRYKVRTLLAPRKRGKNLPV